MPKPLVFIELTDKDYEEGMCGLLKMSLYGTRDAAQNWEATYTEFMISIGYRQGIASPCVLYNEDKELRCVVHGEYFTIFGEDADIKWFPKK